MLFSYVMKDWPSDLSNLHSDETVLQGHIIFLDRLMNLGRVLLCDNNYSVRLWNIRTMKFWIRL
jgi:hypothetical protein